MKIGVVISQFGTILKGGAEIQAENTIKHLIMINCIEIIYIKHDTTVDELLSCDIIHFFKSEPYYTFLIDFLIDNNIPYVVSSIYFPETNISKYKNKLFSNLYSFKYIKKFMRNSRFYLWENAIKIFPNTIDEKNILEYLGVKKDQLQVIYNGIEDEYYNIKHNKNNIFLEKYPLLKNKKFVLNIGRIEKRKNQLELIKACQKNNLFLVIIGNIRDKKYWNECLNLKYNNLLQINFNTNKLFLIDAYRTASVFCLPSTMETPGLSALEAYSQGTQIVVTKYGGAIDYFEEDAYYVDPFNTEDIAVKLKQAIKNPKIHKKDINKFNYNNIAKVYLSEYGNIINKNKIGK